MKTVEINTEYIKLDQFLKLENIVESGGHAKSFILENEILVNGEVEFRRGRKLRNGDVVKVKGQEYKILHTGEQM
ncbi:MAG: S4 domain-containing protein YaaA [Clostridiaceae bacterium]|nr:S4 domain-containing protein YaaA [Clostridiaceae bacterium]